MKKILSFIVLLAGVTMFTSCGDDDATYQATPKLEIASADVLFEADGGDGSIVVNGSGTVTATTDASWLTLSVQGSQVIVTAQPNLTLDGRSAVIKLVSGSTEAQVTATQKSSVYGVPSLEYEIGDYQASLDIDVVHNQKVTVESQSEWLTATFNEGTSQIEIVAEDNNEADPHVGIVTVTMGDYSNDIVITQQGFLLEPETDKIKSTNEAGDYTISISHSRAVTVKSNDEWVTATWNARTNVLSCSITANDTGAPRVGTVTITSGPVVKTVAFIQYEFKDLLGDYALFFTQEQGSEDFYYVPATLSTTSLDFALYSKYPWSIPLVCDEATATFTMTSGSYVGAYGPYFIYLIFMDMADGGYWTGIGQSYSENQTMSATIEADIDEEGYFTVGGKFEGALLDTYPFDGWNFQAMSEQSFTTEASLGYLTRIYDMELVKMAPAASRATGSRASRISKYANAKPLELNRPATIKAN